MTAAFILTGLRVQRSDLASIYKGVGLMKESTAFDEYLEAELRSHIGILLRLGRKKFGPPEAAVVTEFTEVTDLDRLGRMADAIFTATSWEELLATH